ncbi:lysylphosphatidylglycerol synthase domain-containing protein [Acidianus sulfidivorans]|nr:lysylphosphatidylglycerol synthase domain-containing protein [Acidianus sulfidivorans]
MNWKIFLSAILPILVLLLYSLIFHVNIILSLQKINIIVILSFIASYLIQILIIAIRDKRIVKVSLFNAYKARLLGNAVGLIIPGWAGQELTRAIVYSRENHDLIDSFSLSVAEASFDVIAGCILFLGILPLKFYALEFLYILIAVGNIAGWGIGMAYVYSTAGKHIGIEKSILRLVRFDQYYSVLLKGKDAIKNSINDYYILIYFIITLSGYLILSAGIFPLLHDYLYDVIITMSYFAATLFPIPGASGVSEIALAIFLPSTYVFDIVILEYVAYSLGFIFIGEININELKKEMRKIKEYGKFYQDSKS